MRIRLAKLERIREMGVEPYPYRFEQTHRTADILNRWDDYQNAGAPVKIAGRLMAIRLMGKVAFAHLQDEEHRIQIYFKHDHLGNEGWELFKLLDIGDIIGLSGRLFRTKTGERTIEVSAFALLSKNIRPLPAIKEREGEVWNRWADMEERCRYRTVDLLVNHDSRNVFMKRSRMVGALRAFMDVHGFVEVETPVFQPIYGGAAALPFVTQHHALDMQLYLRIADELYLKRLIAGGLSRVYEIAKDFRNEGIDRLHSPEFTMLEFYAAYEDYHFCMQLVEEMLPAVANVVNGTTVINWEGREIDLTPPYRRATMADLMKQTCGVEIINRDRNVLAQEAASLGITIDKTWGVGKIIDELFSHKIQPNLIQPTFVLDYPIELSPLAKRHRDNLYLVERFELFIGGLETANAFSELNDPQDQRRRFEEQAHVRAQGDEEAPPIDEDFLQALEVGMPPTAGLGIGIDRLAMLLTDCTNIRDVILFPVLRPKSFT
jgi:lysyl-tRNA synthetase class 2